MVYFLALLAFKLGLSVKDPAKPVSPFLSPPSPSFLPATSPPPPLFYKIPRGGIRTAIYTILGLRQENKE